MTIPDYQTLMLPLLKAVSDGLPHSMSSLFEELSDEFDLTVVERETRLPSGKDTYIKNRIGWARTYLKKAGLLTSPEKAVIQITKSGQDVLKNSPDRINNIFLRQFESFVQFRPRNSDKTKESLTIVDGSDFSTPEEKFESAYQEFREKLESDLLDTIKQSSPYFFEQLVVDIMVALGYGGSRKDAGEATQRSNDGGIDGVIREDKLGLDAIYLQAKKNDERSIGRPQVQEFAGALQGVRAKKGVFITTSTFTTGAKEFVQNIDSKIILIDGERLTQLLIDYDVGVSTRQSYLIKQIDSDYFNED
jgi:restriction system protein